MIRMNTVPFGGVAILPNMPVEIKSLHNNIAKSFLIHIYQDKRPIKLGLEIEG